MNEEVKEGVTAYFLMAWLSDLEGNAFARDHYLTRAFRHLVQGGYTLLF
jgi:hypothetical protein